MEFSGLQYSKMRDAVEDALVELDRVADRIKATNCVDGAIQPPIELEDVVRVRCAGQCVETTATVHHDMASTGNDDIVAIVAIQPGTGGDRRADQGGRLPE